MKALVTELVNEKGLENLRKYFDVDLAYDKSLDEIKAMIADYDVLLVRAETPVKKEMIDAGKKLKAIGMAGIGLNHIDVEYAKSKDIAVFNVPDGSIDSVGELAIGMMLTLMRNIIKADKFVKSGNWDKTGFTGNLLKGKTLGVLALGRIGFRVAELSKSFGTNVIAYDPYAKQEIADKIGAKLVSLDEVLEKSDIITIHTPLTPETRHMIGKAELAKMKDGAFLLNLGRGGIVDEDALYDALKSGKIKGAAMDVMEVEPPAKDNKLFGLDNVIITCHIGAGSVEAQEYISVSLCDKVINRFKELGMIK